MEEEGLGRRVGGKKAWDLGSVGWLLRVIKAVTVYVGKEDEFGRYAI